MNSNTKIWLTLGGLAVALWALSRYTKTGQAITQEAVNVIQNLSDAGRMMIAKHEGFAAYRYNDPPGSDTYSIGYGHQIKPEEVFNDPISKAQALELLAQDTLWAQKAVRDRVTVPLTQAQFDALVDFVYNVGTGNWARSGIAEKLNAGDVQGAMASLLAHDKAHVNGVLTTLPVLVARRQEEAQAFA